MIIESSPNASGPLDALDALHQPSCHISFTIIYVSSLYFGHEKSASNSDRSAGGTHFVLLELDVGTRGLDQTVNHTAVSSYHVHPVVVLDHRGGSVQSRHHLSEHLSYALRGQLRHAIIGNAGAEERRRI